MVTMLIGNIVWNFSRIAKGKYHNRIASKPQNTKITSKDYWSLLDIFLNNKKIPLIPPLFHSNRFISDSKQKAELKSMFTN